MAFRKTLCALLIFCMAFALCACGGEASAPAAPEQTETLPTETPEPTPEPTPVPTPTVEERARELIRGGEYQAAIELLDGADGDEAELLRLKAEISAAAVGEHVLFGSYEQDDVTDNGAEPLEWIVLSRDGDKAQLMTWYLIDTQPYHDVFDGTSTWAECTLHAWLNEVFYSAAFTENEQKLVLETELENNDNPAYGTPGGSNTVDRVFLLSIDEARALSREQLLAPVTAYTAHRGGTVNAMGNGWWWLRSPGVYSRDAAYVDALGKISEYGYIIHRSAWNIRPVIWVDLSV